ncbi:hypothetical protein Pelo_16636 [Pelomyxa schiedti]|nr:hypothetical protein Pelo_16636 [Pelomyxa schiedti]
MDSRTSVHVIKIACHVVVAVFVRPAALCADHYLRCLILCAILQSLASKAEFVYFVEVHTFDNASVNKCLTSLLYCGMLVAKRWVQSVEVGFLLPGHGHGLQDQLFSSLHVPLHTQDALTVPAFLKLCEYAYQHKPIVYFHKVHELGLAREALKSGGL